MDALFDDSQKELNNISDGILTSMLKDLARLRNELKTIADQCSKAREAFKTTPEFITFQELEDKQEKIELKVEGMEDAIRGLSLDLFRLDSSHLKDYGAVKIKIFKKIEYDEKKSIEYCIAHNLPQLLKLSKREFENFALQYNPDFIKIIEEPRAQISADLSKYLNKE